MAMKVGTMRKPWASHCVVVNRDKSCDKICPDFPKAMSIGSGMGGRYCGHCSTPGSASPNRLVFGR